MPLLSTYNCFSVLPISEINEIVETIEVMQNPLPNPTPNCRPNWERRLLSKLVIAASKDNPKPLRLKVEVENTDTVEIKSLNSLVDSRATGKFIDRQFVKSCKLRTRKLS